mmetsp:Transcript_26352/g.38785  ORF Transcript_26352/g.38785 Transcript_26352/m.38785 type:complete len:89 (-) Transcript_26352:24-290(-)
MIRHTLTSSEDAFHATNTQTHLDVLYRLCCVAGLNIVCCAPPFATYAGLHCWLGILVCGTNLQRLLGTPPALLLCTRSYVGIYTFMCV